MSQTVKTAIAGFGGAMLAMLLVAAGVVIGVNYVRGPVVPSPAIAAEAAGKAYGPILAPSYARAWDAAADQVEKDGDLAKALASVNPTAHEARVPTFNRDVLPIFNRIVPEGTKPETVRAEERRAIAEAFRAFGRGVSP